MIKLEVGKTYLDREGRKVVIVSKRDDNFFLFVGHNSKTYTTSGTLFTKLKSPFDLIAEAPDVKPKLQLELGKTYLSRGGEMVTIKGNSSYDTYPFDGGNGRTYTANGVVFVGVETINDLIEDVTDVKPELQLELGKTYLTREGNRVKIKSETGFETHPFKGSNNWGYTTSGAIWSTGEKSPNDLITEAPKDKHKLQLKVGETYLTRGGDKVKIVSNGDDDHFPFNGDNELGYTIGGEISSTGKEYPEDLIEEAPTQTTPPHYDNSQGSLYAFAEQQKLNSWEFDILKRIVRCRKKGQWREDLIKTKAVIDLYLDEYEG